MRICKPLMVSPVSHAGKDSTGQGKSSAGGLHLENTAAVPTSTPTIEWLLRRPLGVPQLVF